MAMLDRLTIWVSKQDRTYLIVMAVLVVLLIAILVLGFITVKDWNNQKDLQGQVSQAQATLTAARAAQQVDIQALQNQVATAQAQLNATRNLFPNEKAVAEALQKIPTIGSELGLSVTPLTVQPAPTPLPGTSPQAVITGTYKLQASGPQKQYPVFLQRIQQETVGSLTVSNVNITQGPGPDSTLTADIQVNYVREAQSAGAIPTLAPIPTISIEPLIQQANAALQTANYEQAINLLQQALILQPQRGDIQAQLLKTRREYASKLLVSGQLAQAAAQYQEILKQAPGDPEAVNGLRQAEAAQANPTPTLGPTATPARDQAINAAFAAGQWNQVITMTLSLQSQGYNTPDMIQKLYIAYVRLGDQYLNQGIPADAKKQYQAALSINPGGAEAVAGLQRLAVIAGVTPAVPPLSSIPTATPRPQPTPGPPTLAPDAITSDRYTVRTGDTLFTIARRAGVSVQQLMQANNISGYTVYIGQVLIIPGRTG
ncbi:MAG: LysM peptidoglycan-binding domain-containing protein [Chloroflexi bacterium]|nr:LysM peptidoglycan-binding domain-containing protein [Chloroflexota bacterium]